MTTNYNMWITYNADAEKLHLPVLPETFTVSIGSNNSSVDVVGLGEIIVKQARPAFQFQFSSFFPKTTFPGVNGALTDPLTCVDKLKTWHNGDKPVKLVLSNLNISVYCTIENFKYYEQGGDVGTIHYDITLKEYREVTVRQVKVEAKTQKATVEKTETRVDNTVQPQTYTVKKGDCLWNIAKKLLGNGAKYTQIAAANKGIIKNLNLIYAGQVLTIPMVK